MFIGHYAIGFASKRLAPETSLAALFIASLWMDLLWPVLLLLGIEKVTILPGITAVSPFDFEYYPFSHSLIAAFIWAILSGALYFALRRSLRSATVIGALVLSHWLLDLIVHRPDLPILFTGEARLGLGLWNSVAGTILVEGGLFIAGVYLYLSSTSAINKKGKYGPWALAGLFVFIYAGQFSGTTPPSQTVVAVTGLLQWLFIIFAYWIDKNRAAPPLI